MQRTEAEESSRGHITDGLLINHTEGISLYAAGDSKHDKVLDRRVGDQEHSGSRGRSEGSGPGVG